MSLENVNPRNNLVIPSALLALGIAVCGWLLGIEIKAAKLGDRYVSVKGLAERTVKSDLAIWPITFKQTGDNIAEVYATTESDKNTVLRFLSEQQIQQGEIELGVIRVVDTQAKEEGGQRAPHRYVAEQQITVRTPRVDQVAAAAQKTGQLLQKGVVLNSDRGSGVTYIFKGLNGIKPDMITEATRNAHSAAERFAADSGSKVGSIRQAAQGVFSILAADQPAATEDNDYSQSDSGSMMKTIRVVTSVDYFLEQ